MAQNVTELVNSLNELRNKVAENAKAALDGNQIKDVNRGMRVSRLLKRTVDQISRIYAEPVQADAPKAGKGKGKAKAQKATATS